MKKNKERKVRIHQSESRSFVILSSCLKENDCLLLPALAGLQLVLMFGLVGVVQVVGK